MSLEYNLNTGNLPDGGITAITAVTCWDAIPSNNGVSRLLWTTKGPVWIESHDAVVNILQFEVDGGIGIFAHYVPEARQRQKEMLLRVAGMRDGNSVVAYTPAGNIVGYICLSSPAPSARWGGAEFDFVQEFGLMEISRDWRGLGLAEQLMEAAFHDDSVEDRIVVAPCYTWYWDVDFNHKTKQQYRESLRDILAREGFVEIETDEENVSFDAANLLMARYGKRVPPEKVAAFQNTLFELEF